MAGTSTTATVYTSRHPAGDTWGAPTMLSVPGDNAITPRAAADAAGIFVVGWADSTTNTLSMLTSPPGGGFGPAAAFTAAAMDDLKVAPGHAVLSIKPVIPTAPMSISSEPVS
jgi:hypothetical protein